MIELSQFIESTLFDIALGVQKAKVRAADLAAIVPPKVDGRDTGETTHVEFDIAVKTASSVTSGSNGSGKIGVKARIFVVDASAEVSGQKQSATETGSEHHHRISFKVPIHLNAHFRGSQSIADDAAVIRKVEERENSGG